MEQMLYNYFNLQDFLWDRQGVSKCQTCSACLCQSGERGRRLCLWGQGLGPPTNTDMTLTALGSLFPCSFWQRCKEKSVMLLEMPRNGAAKRSSGQRANAMLALQPHSVGSVLPYRGQTLLSYLKSPFFFTLWGSNGAEMK